MKRALWILPLLFALACFGQNRREMLARRNAEAGGGGGSGTGVVGPPQIYSVGSNSTPSGVAAGTAFSCTNTFASSPYSTSQLAIIHFTWYASPTVALTNINIGGTNATVLAVKHFLSADTGGSNLVAYLVNPPTGAQKISGIWAGTTAEITLQVEAITNAAQSSIFSAIAITNVTQSSVGVTNQIACATNTLVLNFVAAGLGSQVFDPVSFNAGWANVLSTATSSSGEEANASKMTGVNLTSVTNLFSCTPNAFIDFSAIGFYINGTK